MISNWAAAPAQITNAKANRLGEKYMQIETMRVSDIDSVIPLYIDYYNHHEGACWTEAAAKKCIRQILTMEDSCSLILKDDQGEACGFAMGYFKQYDDLVSYILEEIVIAYRCQNQGLGSMLLSALEAKVREAGASSVQLQAVNDAMHERYYGKAGYQNVKNLIPKVKWLV